MIQFAVVNESTGEVIAFRDAEAQLPSADGLAFHEINPRLSGWPAEPFAGAVLKWGASGLAWHDPRDLAQQRADTWAAIKAHRQTLDEAPFALQGFAIDADMQSRQDIMGAIMAMQLTGQTTRPWRCADNVMRELTLAQIVAVGTGIAARRQQLIETSDQLYQQLQAATDGAAISAVSWPAD